jgi:hypothetical protein
MLPSFDRRQADKRLAGTVHGHCRPRRVGGRWHATFVQDGRNLACWLALKLGETRASALAPSVVASFALRPFSILRASAAP